MSELVVQRDEVEILAANRFEGPQGVGYDVRVHMN